MAKDPAVLLYTSDFLSGCAGLTMEERGQYITLLCLQHQQGHLSEKTCRLTIGSISVDVLDKFKKDETGLLYNERMDIEIEKRRNSAEIKRLNGLKGGRPKTKEEPTGYPIGKPTANLPKDENEDINKDINTGSDNWEKEANRKRPLSECLGISIKDDGWVRKNKTNIAELQTFNDYLEKIGETEKTLNDYKKHFANLKMKSPEKVKNQSSSLLNTIHAIKGQNPAA